MGHVLVPGLPPRNDCSDKKEVAEWSEKLEEVEKQFEKIKRIEMLKASSQVGLDIILNTNLWKAVKNTEGKIREDVLLNAWNYIDYCVLAVQMNLGVKMNNVRKVYVTKKPIGSARPFTKIEIIKL